MRVKICGITTVGDAVAAVEAGTDAIGLNLYAGPRRIDADRATAIRESLPPFVTPVALVPLVDGRLADDLVHLLIQNRIDLLQTYGDVTVDALIRLSEAGFGVIQSMAVRDAGFAEARPSWGEGQWRPRAVILDAYDPNRSGGTGKAFCWDWVDEALKAGRLDGWPPIVLAGGLNPDNVDEAIRIVRPYAVDVSSGVEVEGAPGRKDPRKMRDFIRSAKAALERNDA